MSVMPADSVARAIIRAGGGSVLTATGGPELKFGEVPEGWDGKRWSRRLRQLAESCEQLRPDLALLYREWSEKIEKSLSPENG